MPTADCIHAVRVAFLSKLSTGYKVDAPPSPADFDDGLHFGLADPKGRRIGLVVIDENFLDDHTPAEIAKALADWNVVHQALAAWRRAEASGETADRAVIVTNTGVRTAE